MYRTLKKFVPQSLKNALSKRVADLYLKGVIPPKLLPTDFAEWIGKYNRMADATARESYIRELMGLLAVNPSYGSLLQTDYAAHRFGSEPLFWNVVGAMHFANGRIDEAFAVFKKLSTDFPSPFHALNAGRCLAVGLGKEREAIAWFDEALKRFPNDLSLTMNLATAHFRMNETARANQMLDGVREDFIKTTGAVVPQERVLRTAGEAVEAIRAKTLVRPNPYEKYYDESVIEKTYWQHYWYQMVSDNQYQSGFGYINHVYRSRLKRAIEEFPEIRSVINFGVMCAEPDYQLAKAFPKVQFYGVDRERKTAELNKAAYRTPNFDFIVAYDIMEAIPTLAPPKSPALLFHARTGTLCYPEFLRQLYKRSASNGVGFIALFENLSLSRERVRYYDYADMPADAIAYKEFQFIHHYERYLNEAGYEIARLEKLTASNLLEATTALGDTHAFILARKK